MKRVLVIPTIIAFVLILMPSVFAISDSADLNPQIQPGLSTIYISSTDSEGESREFVDASKSNITTGSMKMIGANGSMLYDGDLTQIKARGNSTFIHADKKSYQIKLKDKTDLLGPGEKVKTWVLLACYFDATKLHDKTMKDLAASLGMDYVASSDWVNVYYDGEYRGLYLLSEKNSVSKTSININDLEDEYEKLNDDYGINPTIEFDDNHYNQTYRYTVGLTDPEDISGGYLLELNGSVVDEASGFYTKRSRAVNVKSPEWASKEAMLYISEFYQEFEDAVYATDSFGNNTGYNEKTGKHYYDYVDKESLVRLFLLQELSLNPDEFSYSTFFYKDKSSDYMICGPIWDQDMVFGTNWRDKLSPEKERRHYLTVALSNIPDFRRAVRQYYQNTFADKAKTLLGKNGYIEQNAARIQSSVEKDHTLWPYIEIVNPTINNILWSEETTYQDIVDDMSDWIQKRLDYLDKKYLEDASFFDDVFEKDYFSKAVSWAVGKDITNGIDETHFGPDQSCTRAQMVTFLWRAIGSPEPTSADNPFTDVEAGSYYEKAVLWAVENGITTGTSETTFSPNDTVTRGQSVTFLYRMKNPLSQSASLSDSSPEGGAEECSFTDVAKDAYYYDTVLWAAKNGVTTGKTETLFAPDDDCTRAQIVTFLYRAMAE